jgi:hypothetical protein
MVCRLRRHATRVTVQRPRHETGLPSARFRDRVAGGAEASVRGRFRRCLARLAEVIPVL